MKKFLVSLIVIFLIVSPAYSQSGWGEDPGALDSILIECDSLIVGRSMPITFRVVNDDPLRTIFTNYIFEFSGGAGMHFDSLVYMNSLLDPSVLDYRSARATDSSLRVLAYKMIGNDFPAGGSEIVQYFYTASSPGDLLIDSVSLPPGYEFAFISQMPGHFVAYYPQFEKTSIPIVSGTPYPILTIDNNNITSTVGNVVSTNMSISSPVGFPVDVSISNFSKYDNSETSLNPPELINNVFEWSPSSSDIGIWQAVIEGCDSSGTCVEHAILIQVLESDDYFMEFNTTTIGDFHQPDDMVWEDIDDDPYPEIITVGYHADLKTTFATYNLDLNSKTLNLNYKADGQVYYRRKLALGYINSDNYIDAIHPQYLINGNAITVLAGKSNYEFDDINAIESNSANYVKDNAVLNEFNNDEFLDYAAGGGNIVTLFSGLGNGSFEEYSTIVFSERVRSLNSSDFNLDGSNDLAIGTDAGVYIYHNLGNGTFQQIEFHPQSYGTADIDITNNGSDFNGDMSFDFVITTPSVGGEYSEIVLYEGNSDGTFNAKSVRTLKGQVFGNSIGDFNNDNNLDIAFVNGAFKYIGILYGDGNGNFTNEQRFNVGNVPIFSINCVDFDLDGDLDISSVGTVGYDGGTLYLFENQSNPTPASIQSLDINVLNNANLQMTSPNGKTINNISSSFSSSSTYLKDIDNNAFIDRLFSFKTVEDGVYNIELTPNVNIQVGELFTTEFSIDNQKFRLAKDIPMAESGYKFPVYLSGNSPIHPLPGQFTGNRQPEFQWDAIGPVDFQLASDINFSQIILDSTLSAQSLSLSTELSVTDTTAFFWRVKPSVQPDYSSTYVFNVVLNCCVGVRGNVNNDYDEQLDISDLVFLVSYMFASPAGQQPPCFEEADVDGSLEIDISDLVFLVTYMFGNQGNSTLIDCP